MNWKTKMFIVLIVVSQTASSQFDKIPIKTKLCYSLYRYKVQPVINGEDTLFRRKDTLIISIDSIIHIKNRGKLVFFSKCINSLWFNSTTHILKGNVKQSNLELLNFSYLTDNVKDYSLEQATILYMIKSSVFTITVPTNFLKKKLSSNASIKKFCNAVIQRFDSSETEVLNSPYIHFEDYNFPIIPFVQLAVGKQIFLQDNQYDLDFYNFRGYTQDDGIYGGRITEYNKKIRSWIMGKVFISNRYGVIKSQSLARTKQYAYYNDVELIDIRFP